MSNANRGSAEAIIPTSPRRFTSKNPTVIQTAYWCVRTVVRFMTRCNISIRQEGCSRLSSSGEPGSLGWPSPTLVDGCSGVTGKLLPGQIDHTRFG